MVFTTSPFLGTDLLYSIAYSERIKIETFCELGLSNILWAYRLKDRTAATVNEALTKFLATFKGPVHSFTVDRGTEFSNLVSLNHNTVYRPITAMLTRPLNAAVMNDLIGTYVIFTLRGLVLSTLVLKI